jgi:hypothetical protein
MKRENIFLIFGVLLAVIIFISVVFFSSPNPAPVGSPRPSSAPPSRYPIVSIQPEYSPPKQNELPYLPQNRGGGIDTKSPAVKQSAEEIGKLVSGLPYQQSWNLTNGQSVEAAIPGKNLQLNAWTLTVQIFGIDYQSPEGSEDYEVAKSSFLEAANKVFAWMKSKNADPNKIIISWGDRQFIQERAEKWLSQ